MYVEKQLWRLCTGQPNIFRQCPPQNPDIRSLITSSAIHRCLLSQFFLREGGRYTGYPTQMFLICRKSCNTLYTRLHPFRCEKCNSCTLYCQLPLILMITVTKIMMMVKIMRKKTIYSRTSVTRTKSRFPSFCRGGEGKKEGGGKLFLKKYRGVSSFIVRYIFKQQSTNNKFYANPIAFC